MQQEVFIYLDDSGTLHKNSVGQFFVYAGYIFLSKKSIHRYKDYCIKRIAKAKLIELINKKLIDPSIPITLRFFIDNQPTSTDAIYNLKESIHEELSAGIANFDYGTFHKPIFSNTVSVHTKFCDSKSSYLIQASDMLANCIFTKYNFRPELKCNSDNHTAITLP